MLSHPSDEDKKNSRGEPFSTASYSWVEDCGRCLLYIGMISINWVVTHECWVARYIFFCACIVLTRDCSNDVNLMGKRKVVLESIGSELRLATIH